MRAVPPISNEIGRITRQLRRYAGAKDVTIPGECFAVILASLDTLRTFAVNMERELGASRLLEAARAGRRAVDELMISQTCELLVDPDGKVIRPDFGRKHHE